MNFLKIVREPRLQVTLKFLFPIEAHLSDCNHARSMAMAIVHIEKGVIVF